MALIDSAQATDVTINATVDGGGGDWAPSGEVYPVVLGWGVELSAPGVYFLDPVGGNSSIFDVTPNSTLDTRGYASVVGTAMAPVGVGMNVSGTQQMDDTQAILVEDGGTLYLANAIVNGSASNSGQGLNVLSGTLVLGQDRSGTVMGGVRIGMSASSDPDVSTRGYVGLQCKGVSGASGVVEDVALGGQSAVTIEGQVVDVIAGDYCNLSLSANPKFGFQSATAAGCPVTADLFGVGVAGRANVALANATISCFLSDAVDATPSGPNSAPPLVTIDSSIIQSSAVGIYAYDGTVLVTNSTIVNNGYGVWQHTNGITNGSIDLSGGGNAVICNEAGQLVGSGIGVDVYNTSTAVLNASNVAWDTAGPDYFDCDSTLTDCTCNLSSCTADPGANGMDAVEDSTILGGILTSGNSLSGLWLDAGCN